MSDSKLPSNWIKKISKTKNKSYFFNKSTGQSLWSQAETSSPSNVKSSGPSSSSLNKLNSSSLVIKKSPAQDRLQRIQKELIAKQLIDTAKTSAKPNDARSSHLSASPKSATKQSNNWRLPPKSATKHSNWDSNTTNSTPSNPKLTKTNSSSIPTLKNTKISFTIPKQDSINLSRNIKLPGTTQPTAPLSNRLKFSKIPKISKIDQEKNLPNSSKNATEPKTGNYNQNNSQRKPDSVQPVFKTRQVYGTEEPKTKQKRTGQPDTKDSHIGSAVLQSQVTSIPPNLPEAAALSNQNIRKAEYTVKVNITEASLEGQKSAQSENSSVQPDDTLPNAVLPTSSAASRSQSTQETPFTLPDSISNCNQAQQLQSPPSIFAGIFSGFKSFTQFWGGTTKASEQVLPNNDISPKCNSSIRRPLDSVNASGKGILDSSKDELTAIQQRLKLNKPLFEDHNVVLRPKDNSRLDDVDVEMTDDDDMTSDSNGKCFCSSLAPGLNK